MILKCQECGHEVESSQMGSDYFRLTVAGRGGSNDDCSEAEHVHECPVCHTAESFEEIRDES